MAMVSEQVLYNPIPKKERIMGSKGRDGETKSVGITSVPQGFMASVIRRLRPKAEAPMIPSRATHSCRRWNCGSRHATVLQGATVVAC